MHNITIKNLKIEGFVIGINSYTIDPPHTDFRRPTYRSALNIKLIDNEIATVNADDILSGYLAGCGIYLQFAENTVISGNTIKAQNPTRGLYVGKCNNTLIVDNKFVDCGLQLSSLSQVTLINNVIDDKPVVFLKSVSDSIVDNAEQVFLYNCTRISVRDVNPSANYQGTVQLEETSDSMIVNCGGNIALTRANNNTIRNGSPHTITLKESSNNEIASNVITESGQCLKLSAASNANEIHRNIIKNSRNSSEAQSLFNAGQNTLGIQLGESEGNKIYGNTIVNHALGLDCDEISNTKIYDNIISDCNSAISLYASEDDQNLSKQHN